MQHIHAVGEDNFSAQKYHESLQFLLAQIESVAHGEDQHDARMILQRKEALKRELDYCW